MTTWIQELTCMATGGDSPADAAWLAAELADDLDFKCAAAHWAATTDDHRDAIADALGLSTPFPRDPESDPLPIPSRLYHRYRGSMNKAYTIMEGTWYV